MKVIVLGSSHGGYEAVEELLNIHPDAEIQWYEKGDFISFLSCGMQLYLEGKVKDVNSVRYMTGEKMESRGVNVFSNTEITEIKPESHQVVVKDLLSGEERVESYDKLIISPGAVPFELNVPGKDLENIYLMRGRKWAIKLKAKTVDPEVNNVVVIGSGYIGIEAAESFAKAGKKVTVIDILDRPLGVYLDKEFTDVLTEEMEANNINVVTNETVQSYKGEGHVQKVVTDKAEYDTDLVVVAVGVRPNTGWLKDTLELHPNGLIKTDEYMQTSAPDVFAVGDATMIKYNPGETEVNIALATNARKQGRFAVKNLNGPVKPFPGIQGSSGLAVFDYKFASTGINEEMAKKLNKTTKSALVVEDYLMDFNPDKQKAWFKLVYDPETTQILGAQLMSKADLTANINAISLAIKAKMTIEDLAYADFFFQPSFDKPWNIINTAALAAMKNEQ
ncbi:FAD-dependent oxidoreductase [Enterococcus caccae]|uniref:NADH peroxidase n=1 Tax=Enterococcus caccae ATCC BAA-1240 TaxID=1158612 RepID=R3TS03_9ENTE|nr:FAD-dependent oxidoreductase [Enterococcus caccae]EOL44359.1 NADH peroxidase [Enterococcus caccae ATCC BAA-1240]EOT68525.1 NADH peroxidase [Enterococcus caccae ATCC BAA-1240]OJG28262.1 NADH peroxidase [Enterococcus caccae]